MTLTYFECTKRKPRPPRSSNASPNHSPTHPRAISLQERNAHLMAHKHRDSQHKDASFTFGNEVSQERTTTNRMSYLTPDRNAVNQLNAPISPSSSPNGGSRTSLSPQRIPSRTKSLSPSPTKRSVSPYNASSVSFGNDHMKEDKLQSTSQDYKLYEPNAYADQKRFIQGNHNLGRSSVSMAHNVKSKNAPPSPPGNVFMSSIQRSNKWREDNPELSTEIHGDVQRDATNFRNFNRVSNVVMGFESDKHQSTVKKDYDNPWNAREKPQRTLPSTESMMNQNSSIVHDAKKPSPEDINDLYLSSTKRASVHLTPEARQEAFQNARKENVQRQLKHANTVSFGDDNSPTTMMTSAQLAHPGHVYVTSQ